MGPTAVAGQVYAGLRQDGAAPRQNLFQIVGYPCLLLFLFFFYSRLLDITVSYLHLPLLLGSVAIFAAALSGNLVEVVRSRIGVALLLFTVWAFAGVPFSVWRGGSFDVLTGRWIRAVAVFLATGCLINSGSQLSRVMRWVAWGIVAACSIALIANVTLWDGRLGFPGGELANPNQLAYSATAAMTMLYIIVGSRRRHLVYRIAAICALAIPIAVLSRSGSRAGFICFLLLGLLGFLGAGARGKVMIGVGLLLAAALFVAVAPERVQKRFFVMASSAAAAPEESASAAESAQSRLQLIKDGVWITLQNPLFGVGAGNYAVTRNDLMMKLHAQSAWSVTHNSFLQVSSECGIPALALYVAAIFFTFQALRTTRKLVLAMPHGRPGELAHIAFCLRLCLVSTCAFFFFSSSAYDFYFPTLAGLALALERIARDESAAARVEPVASEPGRTPAGVSVRPTRTP